MVKFTVAFDKEREEVTISNIEGIEPSKIVEFIPYLAGRLGYRGDLKIWIKQVLKLGG